MNAEDRKPFLEIVMGFAELRGKVLSAPALELYWNAMQGWDLADFRAAAEHLLRTCRWMPTPDHFEDLRKAGRNTAGEAWLVARCHIIWTFEGFTLHRDCPPLVAKAVHMVGGPNVIGMCDENKLTFLEKRFVEHYEAIEDATDTRQTLPQITDRPNWLQLQQAVAAKRLAR